jgi:membrane protein required for colicin V production
MDSPGFTAFDGAVLLVLLISGVLAFARGFVHEVLAVGAWIGAIAATVYGLPYARPFALRLVGNEPIPVVGTAVGNETIADVAAGAAIFLVMLILLSLITSAISSRVRGSQLSALDRSLGLAFGLARGAVLLSILYAVVEWMVPAAEQPDWLRNARSTRLLQPGAAMLRSLVPDETIGNEPSSTDKALDDARRVLETERLWREMMSPTPKAPSSGNDPGEAGYGNRERQEMERLIESSRERQ